MQPLKQPAAASTPVPEAAPEPAPSVERSRELMTQLAGLTNLQGTVTGEQGTVVKQQLAALGRQGPMALPAIREFLAQHMDILFASPDAARAAGTTSLRQGLLDILQPVCPLNTPPELWAFHPQPAANSSGLSQGGPGQAAVRLANAARQGPGVGWPRAPRSPQPSCRSGDPDGYHRANRGGGSVPDGGTTITLLAFALMGLGALRQVIARVQ